MKKKDSVDKKFPAIVYGLDGVMTLFQCSRSRASRLVHGKIEGAVSRDGNIIVVDTAAALRLFGVREPERFVK